LASFLGTEWRRIVPGTLSLLAGSIAISFTSGMWGNPSHNCEDSIERKSLFMFSARTDRLYSWYNVDKNYYAWRHAGELRQDRVKLAN
jgi:hypothetical protein